MKNQLRNNKNLIKSNKTALNCCCGLPPNIPCSTLCLGENFPEYLILKWPGNTYGSAFLYPYGGSSLPCYKTWCNIYNDISISEWTAGFSQTNASDGNRILFQAALYYPQIHGRALREIWDKDITDLIPLSDCCTGFDNIELESRNMEFSENLTVSSICSPYNKCGYCFPDGFTSVEITLNGVIAGSSYCNDCSYINNTFVLDIPYANNYCQGQDTFIFNGVCSSYNLSLTIQFYLWGSSNINDDQHDGVYAYIFVTTSWGFGGSSFATFGKFLVSTPSIPSTINCPLIASHNIYKIPYPSDELSCNFSNATASLTLI